MKILIVGGYNSNHIRIMRDFNTLNIECVEASAGGKAVRRLKQAAAGADVVIVWTKFCNHMVSELVRSSVRRGTLIVLQGGGVPTIYEAVRKVGANINAPSRP